MLKKITAMLFLGLMLVAVPAVYGADRQACITLPIVMYHHISPEARRLGKYVITPDEFEQDLKYLKENGYETISSAQLKDWLDGKGSLPEKPVMITFDDGYESTAVYACPLLEKYGMHGIVAVIGTVTTQYTETPDHHLGYSHMSWEAVAELDSGTVMEVQCHTNNMHKLTPRKGCKKMSGESMADYEKALMDDINTFQNAFVKSTGHKSDVLVLPFGIYSSETLDIAGQMGFRMVFTCTEKVNSISENDAGKMQVLGRFNRPHGITSETFFAKWNKKL
jgi:peptidoglycan/xylan/chitin deacetylase (PgdA/CDA1 family)